MPIHNPKGPASDFINRQWAASHIYVPGRAAKRVRQEQAKIESMEREAMAARSLSEAVPIRKTGDTLGTLAFWSNVALAWLVYVISGEALHAADATIIGLTLLKLAKSTFGNRFIRILIHLALIVAPVTLLGL